MPVSRPKLRSVVKGGAFAALVGACILSGLAYFLLKRENLNDRLKGALQPHVPFQITRLEIDASLKDLLQGNLGWLKLSVAKAPWSADLEGPLELKTSHLLFAPDVMLAFNGLKSDPLTLTITARPKTEFSLNNLVTSRIEFEIDQSKFRFPALGLELEKPSLMASADLTGGKGDSPRIKATLKLGRAFWADPLKPDERAVEGRGFVLDAKGDLTSPLPIAATEMSLRELDVLFGSELLELKTAQFHLTSSANGKTAELTLTEGGKTILHSTLPETRDRVVTDIRLPNLKPLYAFVSTLLTLPKTEVLDGSFHTRFTTDLASTRFRGSFQFNLPRLRSKDLKLAIKNLTLSGPFDGNLTRERIHFEPNLKFERLYLRQLPLRLDDLGIELTLSPTLSSIETTAPLLSIETTPAPKQLEIGPFEWILTQTEAGPRLEGSGDLKVRLQLKPILDGLLCLPPKQVPDLRLTLDWPWVEFFTEEAGKFGLEIDGVTRMKVFDGLIELKDPIVFDWNTPLPEVDFSAEWDLIDLNSIGKWLGIGGMDGYLRGYAKDVVAVGTLPTRYEFLIEPRPKNKKYVTFSASAMGNILKMIGADLNEIPGLKWLYFGLPRDLLGGYKILEAGTKLTSRDGFVIVETLSSEETLRLTGQHYFIYGVPSLGIRWINTSAVRVPLTTKKYPAILDQTSFANYFNRIGSYFIQQFQDNNSGEGSSVELLKELGETASPYETCQPPDI